MISSFLSALRHLSVLPLGGERRPSAGREGDAAAFFPAAGLALALCPAAVLVLAARVLALPRPLPEALAVAALAAVTGGRHLAGLAAAVDAALSKRPALGALEAMREARAGAAGTAAVVLALMVKFAALQALGSPARQAVALLLAVPLARFAAVAVAARSDYARPDAGEDEWLVSCCGGRELRWAMMLLAPVVLILGWAAGPLQTVLAAAGCLLLAWSAAAWFARRFGGATGECIDAVVEAAEVLALVLLCALPGGGGGEPPAAADASASARTPPVAESPSDR